MVEVIPAINATDWETVKRRIQLIAPYTDWIHLDVADGTFTKNITWHNAADLAQGDIPKNIRFEAHLMVDSPEKKLEQWIKVGVRRVILHWEALRPRGIFKGARRKNLENIATLLKENWVEFGISVIFRTDPAELGPYLNFFDMIQVLAVEPGLAGQIPHEREAILAVRNIKKMIIRDKPQIKIEVDGGVNTTNIKAFYLAGANIVAAASAVFGAAEPHLALEALKRSVIG